MAALMQDLRYGLRMLRRSPGFTAVAIITLALGIGANTAIFTVIRAVLLKPLPYADPSRLVSITGGATLERFNEIKAAARSYTGIGAFAVGTENVTLSGSAEPEVLKAARVSADFLQILAVRPLLGRSFNPDEGAPGGAPVAMISGELWQRRFGGDPKVIGKTAALSLTPYTIIGVLPPRFAFPFPDVDVWLPRPEEWSVIPAASRPLSPVLHVFGRLKPGVTLQQATAELAVINHQYAAAYPQMLDAKRGSIETVRPMKDVLVSNVRSMLWMLLGAAGFVLLIACANVASLLLARAASRHREFAIRAALGAGHGRLMRQLLVESVLLAFAGGGLGVLLARWSLRGVTRVSGLDLPRMGEIHLDGMVLGFTVVVSMATGVLFGLLPSRRASRPNLALRDYGAGAGAASGRSDAMGVSTRGLLVVGQVALSMVLLITATLLMVSLVRVEEVNPGFEAANLLTLQVSLPTTKYDAAAKRAAFYKELIRRVESLPGVRRAALALTLPMTGFAMSPVQVVEQPLRRLNQRPLGIIQSITPDYFRTLEIPLERGREFDEHDISGAPPVIMISESLARRFWPGYPQGQNPMGQNLLVGARSKPREIVGIVADVHQAALDAEVRPEVYFPCAQSPPQAMMLAVRTDGNPSHWVNAVRRQILAIDRDQPVSAVQTMEHVVDASLGQRRLILLLLGLFAGVALLLATVGIYGVVSYSVAQRTREIGIRMALGAQRRNVLRLVVGQGFRLALAGVGTGVCGALALERFVRGLLFGVKATDPATFAAVSLVFLAVAVAASYIPARRATQVDPIVALRCE